MDKLSRTRQNIIASSAALFNTYGYYGTSISDVLQVSGYSKGALYNAFEDKEALVKEVFKYNLNRLQTAFIQAIAKKDNARDKLCTIPMFYAEFDLEYVVPGGCPILNTALETDDAHPRLNTLVRSAFENWIAIIVGILEQGKKTGEIKPDLISRSFALYMISTIEGSIALSKTYKDSGILKQNMRLLTQHIQERI
ncbi:MAG: TetR/AcrR family transcriptional regulator [Bacteroidota bacterium]